MGFADNMKAFTEEVARTTNARVQDLARVRETTEKLVKDARDWMKDVTREQQKRAEQLRTALVASHQQRKEQTKALRQDIQQQLGQMRDTLHELLRQTRRERQLHMEGLLTSFGTARTELAGDLRAAAGIWQGRARRS
jgi:ElaB/YqjD/DUF883 family membrane-anchored ribosome-binding protein